MKKSILLAIAMLCWMGASARTQYTNLPTLYVDTDNGASITSKDTYIQATINVVSDDASVACTDVRTGIRGRGNSTWGMPKNPYKIKLDEKQKFMGMTGKAKRWCLLANYFDKSLMRNALAFDVSSFVGMPWTPSYRFVDMVLNGKFVGNYLVTDQVEQHSKRVAVAAQEVGSTDPDSITGGYLVEVDGFYYNEVNYFITNQSVPVTIKYPKDDEINQDQIDYITDYVMDFEDRLFGSDWTDPDKGYRAVVDEETLVNWFITSEFCANTDAFWSTFISKDRNDPKLRFGPVWDFDIAFNNDVYNRCGDMTEQSLVNNSHRYHTWVRRLWQDPWFKGAVYTRWKELQAAGLEATILSNILTYKEILQESQALNYQQWPTLSYRIKYEGNLYDSWEEYVDEIYSFVQNHSTFLTKHFEDAGWVGAIVNPDPNTIYRVNNYYHMWIGTTSDDVSRVTDGVQEDGKDNPTDCEIRFIKQDDGTYAMRIGENRFLTTQPASDELIVTADSTSVYAHFQLQEASLDHDWVTIYCPARSSYLGLNNQKRRSRVWTNKTGGDYMDLWQLEKIGEIEVVEPEPEPEPEPTPDPDPDPEPTPDPDPDPTPTPDPDESYLAQVASEWPLRYYRDEVVAAPGTPVSIFSITGQLMTQGRGTVKVRDLQPGLYIAVTPSATLKFTR